MEVKAEEKGPSEENELVKAVELQVQESASKGASDAKVEEPSSKKEEPKAVSKSVWKSLYYTVAIVAGLVVLHEAVRHRKKLF